MPFLTTNIKRVSGLSGSDPARYENLENSGPFFAIGGQAMFGSGSTGSVGTVGGFNAGCTGGSENTGMSAGGGGAAGTSMAVAQLNNCSPTTSFPPSQAGNPGRPGSPPGSGGPCGPGSPPCSSGCCGSPGAAGPPGAGPGGSGPGGSGPNSLGAVS